MDVQTYFYNLGISAFEGRKFWISGFGGSEVGVSEFQEGRVCRIWYISFLVFRIGILGGHPDSGTGTGPYPQVCHSNIDTTSSYLLFQQPISPKGNSVEYFAA